MGRSGAHRAAIPVTLSGGAPWPGEDDRGEVGPAGRGYGGREVSRRHAQPEDFDHQGHQGHQDHQGHQGGYDGYGRTGGPRGHGRYGPPAEGGLSSPPERYRWPDDPRPPDQGWRPDDPHRHASGGRAARRHASTGPGRPRTRAQARRRQRRLRRLELPLLVVFSLLTAVVVRTFVLQTFFIPSGSMHPTLLEGDRVIVNKLSYHLHDVHRGDVVVFRRPPNLHIDDDDLIKRVIGLPGDTVAAHGRLVYVNGRALHEPYVLPHCRGTDDFLQVTVPSDRVFVMGDNRCDSTDSRVFGPIPENLLVGRAFARIWPPSRLGWL